MPARFPRKIVVVVGSDEIGSAVAVALHRAGLAVVICDDVDPPGMRRGMAFTDAWYVGSAELGAVTAIFCSSVRSIPAVLERRMVAATTWSWPGAAHALDPIAIVDTRKREFTSLQDLRVRAPRGVLTVGIGAGFITGINVEIAVASVDPPAAGAKSIHAAGTAFAEEWTAVADGPHEAIVRALQTDRFTTPRRIGDRVVAGETIGWLGHCAIPAPQAGVLRGLSARGARVPAGACIAEVDPHGEPAACFGLAQHALAIARVVAHSLSARALIAPVDPRTAPSVPSASVPAPPVEADAL